MTLGEYIAEQFRKAFGEALDDKRELLDEVSREAANNIGTAHIEASSLSGGLLGLLTDIPGVGLLGKVVLEPLEKLISPAGGVIEGVSFAWALGTALYPALRALLLPVIHEINAVTTNEIHDAATASELVARGLMTHGHGADEAGGDGFDGDHFDRLVALATTHIGESTLMELFRRNVVDQAYVVTTLGRLGYTEDAANRLIDLERNLLSPADFALAKLRGVISNEELQSRLREVGLTPEDMDILVANTGEPIGLMELLEAYRRGFIDKPRLERGIRQSRVRDEWIDVAEKLRYAPMSTADSVRAVVENYISSDEGGKIAQQNGLDPAHWPILVESWGRPLAHDQMARLVHRGLASRKQYDQAMRESDIKNKYIEQSFEVADRLLPERLIVQAVHFDAIDLKTASKMLLQLGYSQESVSILLKLGLHEAQVKPHELTAQQIITLYEQGTLHKDEAVKHLVSIRYAEQNAKYLLQIADTRVHLKEVAQEQAATRNAYLAGTISADQADKQLRDIGINPGQATHLIQVWNRERRRASKSLTVTEITHAIKQGTLNYEQGFTLLKGLGYTDRDAQILLVSNGGTPPKQPLPTGGAGLGPGPRQ